jgi:hypothetical protein
LAICKAMVVGSEKRITLYVIILFICSFSVAHCHSNRSSDGGIEDIISTDKESCTDLSWEQIVNSEYHHGKWYSRSLNLNSCAELVEVPPKALAWTVRNLECYQLQPFYGILSEDPDFDVHQIFVLCDPFGGCEWDLFISHVYDCLDRYEIAYEVVKPCDTCLGLDFELCTVVIVLRSEKIIDIIAKLVNENNCY